MHMGSEQIKVAIKDLLKKAGYTYSDLAIALNISLPTVRRILTKDDIGLERLLAICDWLGVSLEELAALANRAPVKVTYLTEEQEDFFASFPDAYTYLRYLGRGLAPKDIEEQFGISPRATKWYLNELKTLGLVDTGNNGKARIKIHWPTNWRFPGSLEKKFGRAIYHIATNHLLRKIASHKANFDNADFFLMLDSILVSDRTYREYLDELRAIYRKYTTIARHEMKTIDKSKLHIASVIHGIDREDFITLGMGQVRDRK